MKDHLSLSYNLGTWDPWFQYSPFTIDDSQFTTSDSTYNLIMEKKLTHNDIINGLKTEKNYLCNKYGVVEIGLFGSYASGNPVKDSDIDLLIEFKEPRFEYLAGLKLYLEKKFNKKIEIVRKSKNITNPFIQRIENQVIYV